MKSNDKSVLSSRLLSLIKGKSPSLWHSDDKLFLACSGGLDSVVLGHLIKTAGFSFQILHANFQLRGEESKRDEDFVVSLAKHWGVKIDVRRFDTEQAMSASGTGLQETARNLRYDWFDEVLLKEASSGKWLLTGHHADDQVETVMMNFFRGTGIAGLRGMKEKNGNRLRPLLSVFRNELEDYAHLHDLKWVEDSSNQSSKYTRNFFRLELLPEIEKVFPAVKQNIIETSIRIAEVEQVYTREMDRIIKKLIHKKGEALGIPVNLLRMMSPLDTILHALFSPYGFSAHQIPELKKLMDAATGKFILSDTHRVLKNREWILIDELAKKAISFFIVESETTKVCLESAELTFETLLGIEQFDTNPNHAWIDMRFVKYPLIVRKWKPGDYFYPLGMKKKKKIARFLTDLKLNRIQKENQWVVESNNKIIWVVGRRTDDRVKINSNTKDSLLIKLDQ